MDKELMMYEKLKETAKSQMIEITENSQIEKIVNGIRGGKKYLILQSHLIPEVAFTTTVSVDSVSCFQGNSIAYLGVNLQKPHDRHYRISPNAGAFYLELA